MGRESKQIRNCAKITDQCLYAVLVEKIQKIRFFCEHILGIKK